MTAARIIGRATLADCAASSRVALAIVWGGAEPKELATCPLLLDETPGVAEPVHAADLDPVR